MTAKTPSARHHAVVPSDQRLDARLAKVSQASEPGALFSYGSLQLNDVLMALLMRVPERLPAAITGWQVVALPGRPYPGLVEGASTVSGQLLLGLATHEWKLIDAFEDPAYDLVPVDLEAGGQGWAYVCGPEVAVEHRGWSLAQFERQHLDSYIERCNIWRRRYEAAANGPAETGDA